MGARLLICCRRRRRHLRNYLCALLALATLYLIVQGTSLGALFSSSREISGKFKSRGQEKALTLAPLVAGDAPPRPKPKSSDAVRGVRTDDLFRYAPDADGLFRCLDGSYAMPASRVNDDYCDCPADGSDEPGTDACPNSRFYCEFEDKFLPSGKVNDGICDCCDGSDEWKSTLGAAKVKGFPLSDVLRHAPCIDLCSNVADRQTEERRVRDLGRRLKQQYIQQAKGHITGNMYGEEGEFYPVSRECYDHADFSAVYKVCPWRKVEQTQKGHLFRAGRGGRWDLGRRDGRRALVMGDGDKRGCPGAPRKAVIVFRCGLTNTVASLREEDRCVYLVDFITPAAC